MGTSFANPLCVRFKQFFHMRKTVPRSFRQQMRERAHLIDVQVGSRVRLRRSMLGLTQGKLGETIGLSFQQIQKYEQGATRISASRLHQLSRVLEVPVCFFFEPIDQVPGAAIQSDFNEHVKAFASDPLRNLETAELVDAFLRIEDLAMRYRLLGLAKALAGLAISSGRQKPSART